MTYSDNIAWGSPEYYQARYATVTEELEADLARGSILAWASYAGKMQALVEGAIEALVAAKSQAVAA